MDVGCIVINIGTVAEIYRALSQGIALHRRIVTVAGDAVKTPSNIYARIGTPFRKLTDAAGGFIKDPHKIIMGGPMMGIASASLDVPVVKGTSGLLVFSERQAHIDKGERVHTLRQMRCGLSYAPHAHNAGLIQSEKRFGHTDKNEHLKLHGMRKLHLCLSVKTVSGAVYPNGQAENNRPQGKRKGKRGRKKMDHFKTVSSSPHIRSNVTTASIMRDVCIALLPALVCSVIYFGVRAAFITALSVIFCVGFEFLWQKITKKEVTISDGTAVVTGMLLAFNLPVAVPWWIPLIGAFVAIIIAKQFFGGVGNNFINPALAGRAFLFASWPVLMTNGPRRFPQDSMLPTW